MTPALAVALVVVATVALAGGDPAEAMAVLDNGRHQSIGPEANRGRQRVGRDHATASRSIRTGRPAAAIAAFASAIENIRR